MAIYTAVWNASLPKLEAILHDQKASLLKAEREERLELRRKEARQLHAAFLEKWVYGEDDWMTMPNAHDMCRMPEVVALLEEDEARIPMTSERLDTVARAVLMNSVVHRDRARRDLVECLQRINPDFLRPDPECRRTPPPSEETLRCAAALFVAPMRGYSAVYGDGEVLTYPEILQCSHVVSQAWDLAHNSLVEYQPLAHSRGGAHQIAYQVLKSIGLPEDTLASTLAEVGNRFTCLCGEGAHEKTHHVGFIDIVSSSRSYAPISIYLNFKQVRHIIVEHGQCNKAHHRCLYVGCVPTQLKPVPADKS